jgi:protein SCO1/2
MRRLLVLAAAFALAACTPAAKAPPAKCATSGIDRVGGPIALIDQTGAPVTEAAFAGRPALIYFGFASCPAICPTALQTAARALEARGAGATPVAVALVTVDPERDTPEVLARYVASPAFPPGLRGLTGDPAQLKAARDAFKVYAQRRDDPGSTAGYTMDHTDLFYLMDEAWRPAAVFPSSFTPDEVAACIDAALANRP